ncbi:hypothetical protein RZS08_14455, partial [Arthrospira platensis SPKY1]|nr:hypothetical protein [Arthrospira platensis SPKY1]
GPVGQDKYHGVEHGAFEIGRVGRIEPELGVDHCLGKPEYGIVELAAQKAGEPVDPFRIEGLERVGRLKIGKEGKLIRKFDVDLVLFEQVGADNA